jgi:hypothetical protein
MVELAIEIGGKAALSDAVEMRQFSGGSLGFYSQGKVVVDGRRYQASVTLTEIGSKLLSEAEKAARLAA